MPVKTTWERFFDAHAPIYEDNVFTKNTVREVDFLLDELLIPPGGAVLDVGCGTGRHAIELAKRGYVVTGLDLSSEMLSRAADKAKAENVHVEWVRSNATQFVFPGRYDAAVCLCEGAFGLLGQSDDPIDQPLSILCNISRSLRPQAKALFTVLNGASMLRRYQNKDVAEGRFDPLTMVESSECAPQVRTARRRRSRASIRPNGATSALPHRGYVRAQHPGRNRWELGKKVTRPGRDRDHDRCVQDCRTIGCGRRGQAARLTRSAGPLQ